jgi:hypothetical protein
MANWCSNIVQFTGDSKQLENLQALFEEMAAKEKETQKGQLPDFVKPEDRYLFFIQWDGGILYYDTRWAPNIEVIQQVADCFNCGFIYSYSEMAMGIFGEAEYSSGILTDVSLDWDDFTAYHYNSETDEYVFERNIYNHDYEILEILLERKKAISRLQDR